MISLDIPLISQRPNISRTFEDEAKFLKKISLPNFPIYNSIIIIIQYFSFNILQYSFKFCKNINREKSNKK